MALLAKFSDAMSSMDVNCAGRAGGRRRARRIFAHLAALLLLDELVHLRVDLLERLEARVGLDRHGRHVGSDRGLRCRRRGGDEADELDDGRGTWGGAVFWRRRCDARRAAARRPLSRRAKHRFDRAGGRLPCQRGEAIAEVGGNRLQRHSLNFLRPSSVLPSRARALHAARSPFARRLGRRPDGVAQARCERAQLARTAQELQPNRRTQARTEPRSH